jgi:hypothetical protein
MTSADGGLIIHGMKKTLLIAGLFLVLLALAGLGVVLRSAR